MKLVLTAMDAALADAWTQFCGDLDGVSVHRGSILDVACDAVVSPANSYGFMDGGIDALYVDKFGTAVQDRLRRAILTRHHGELLVGSAEIVETAHPRTPYLIAAPTMRVPMALGADTINPYLATRAVLLLVRHGVFPEGPLAGQRLAEHLRVIAFPGIGTGVGRVPAKIAARQVRTAIDEHLQDTFRLPASWAEASERHQLLYTDRPTRLQY
jgi:O-acetyl-ADP-ribose deacetylase (regulator of RNase III)